VTQIDFVKSDATLSAEYVNGFYGCTYYYGFNVEKAPLDNVHLRRAFSYAIDRQSLVDNVTKGGQIPARWFARPGLVAAPTLESNPDLGITFNLDKAQQELQLALGDMGLASAADLPPITLAFGNTSTHTAIAQAIQQMWSDNLGITVQPQAMDATTYFDTERENSDQIHRSGWCLDYPDASNFDKDVFRSDAVQNYGHFNSPEYDQLVDQAAGLTDEAQRRDLYAQAEQILTVDVAGIAPLYWYTTNQVVKPYVERPVSIIGTEAYEQWDVQAH
jgi:oligopeptide transport system substrate-binding protein